MKNLNLIKRLFMDSHEKQSPQRFARYAAMLIMLLTLGVGQMWALDIYLDITAANWPADGATIKLWPGTGSDVTGTSIATNLYKFTVTSATGTMYFKRMNGGDTWNQGSVTYNSSYNLYKLTGWDAAACSNANISTATKTNYIYFDNSVTNWSNSYKYFVIGHDYPSAYSKIYSMSALSHTKLWYVAQSSDSWTDLTYYAICSPTSSWSGTSWGSSNISNANKYAAPYKGKYDMNNSSSYLFTPASSSNNCALTIDYKDGYSALNYSQTVKKYTSTDGGSTYSAASINSGTVTITPYKLTGNGTVSNSSNTGTLDEASETSVSKDAVYTGEVTVTASANSGYTFVGWFTAASGGSAVSTDASYTYNAPKSTNTIYARFKNETTYTITIANSVNASTSTVSVGATPVQITAPDIDGYEFSSWSAMPSGVTKTSGELTDESIYISATKAATVTANYTEDLSSPWTIKGGTNITGNNWSTAYNMTKKSGHSTESVVYYTFNISSTNSGVSGSADDWSFKVSKDGSTWYGLYASGSYWWKRGTSANQPLNGEQNIQICADVAGPYEIKVDYTTPASPKVTVTFPTKYTVTYSVSPSGAASAITTSPNVSSGGEVASGTSITFTHAAANTGYTWYRWENGSGSSLGTGSTYNTTITANTTVVAKYTENTYSVTVQAGAGGSVSSGSVTGHVSTKVTLPTATPNTGYYFTGWTVTTGSATLTSASSATAAQVNGLTAAATVTANFSPIWYLKGDFNSWGEGNPITLASATSGSAVLTTTSAKLSNSKFKIWNKQTDTYYQKASQSITRAANTASGGWTNGGTSNDMKFNSDVIGDYTFAVTFSSNIPSALTVGYPTAYTITYGAGTINGSSTDISVSPSFTSGDYVLPETDVTFSKGSTKAGYTWKGWYSNVGGTGDAWSTSDASLSLTDTRTGNISVYACYNYATYTATLSTTGSTGYGSGAPANQTATYLQTMPTITPPTATNGYCFMGYWDGEEGTGTQYYNANGTSAHAWDKTSGATLYAYFKKAEITAITLNATAFEPVEAGGTGYVVANPTIDPTPVAPTQICWELLYDNDNPVPGHDVIDDHDGDHPNRVKFSIAGLAAGGYKVRATLHTGSGACGSGTTLSVQEASFTIASDFTVTILYKCGDATIKSSTTNPGKALEGTSITAPDIIGYTFSKWKAGDGVTIDGADGSGEKATATITYTANYNGSLTAIYTKKNVIYFYNTVGWSDVWVYFYTSDKYWADDYGTGAYKGKEFESNKQFWDMHYGQMTQIEGTNIWYFDYTAKGWDGWPNIAFANMNKANSGEDNTSDNDKAFFSNTTSNPIQVIRRGDHKTTLPMFVPLTGQTKQKKNNNKAEYLSDGYWMNYPDNTGYTLKIYSSQDATTPIKTIRFPFSENLTMPLKLNVEFNSAAALYYYTIYREDGTVLSADYGMNTNYHSDVRLNNSSKKISLKTTAPGIYTYTLVYKNTPATDYYISVDYPIGKDDYRVWYSDNAKWSQSSAHAAGWYHPSDVIRKNTDAEVTQYDTVSFFVAKGEGITTSMKFQYASAVGEDGKITWADVASGGITIPSSVVTKPGVYNFIIKQEGTAKPEVEKVEPYTGNYYIRTDNAGNTKWDYFRSRDHQMVYTEFSSNRETNTFGELYTHYFTSWCERGTNIKFCIANDYSSCISDTLAQDVGNPFGNTNDGGTLNSDGSATALDDRYSANVRFMYNETTNKICRAYVGSSTNRARKFLVLKADDTIEGEDEEAISEQGITNGVILLDKQNWMYEEILYIIPGTKFKLFACYAEETPSESGAQYFRGEYEATNNPIPFGDTKSVVLIGGSGSKQKARIIYDFKTNRLMAAWIPSGGAVVGELEINADVLVEREHHEPAQYITFADASSQLSGVKTVYGAMKFNRWILNNRGGSSDDDPNHGKTAEQIATHHAPLPVGQQKSIYERSLYFISFPFDVNANEIFGFGHYWDEWYLEYYDGLNRAKNGYWEDSPPNWKYVTPSMLNDFVLKANEGYILGLDLDFMKADNFDFWSNGISTVELFFPSTTTQGTLQQTNCTIPALGDEYRCKIDRGTTEGNRTIKDSYWRCLGVPSFNIYNTSLKDASGTAITWQPDGDELPFIYAWNKADNTLTAQSTSTFTFLPMHAYLVQNGGEIRWENVSAKPASPIVARRVNEQPATEYEWRLALTSDSVLIDQTYVKMSNIEQVTDTFDFNQDMIKEFNAYRSDIYTYIGYERVAANSMPLQTEQTTVIPVGVKIKDAGDYTFAMPDGTNGVGVTLIDTQTGVRTNLGLMDYTVTLTAGSFNQRFVLEISPIMQTPTDIEEVTGDGVQVTGVRKVLIDQKMYIIKDGKVYDARGAKVK